MSAQYNLATTFHSSQPLHSTLIGNWAEERALHEATGVTQHGSLPLERVLPADTHRRTIAHERMDYWKELTRVDIDVDHDVDHDRYISQTKRSHPHYNDQQYVDIDKRYHNAKWDERSRAERFHHATPSVTAESAQFQRKQSLISSYKRGHSSPIHLIAQQSHLPSPFFPGLYQNELTGVAQSQIHYVNTQTEFKTSNV